MTTTTPSTPPTTTPSTPHSGPARRGPVTEDDLLRRVDRIGPELAEHSARHDRAGTFVSESYDALRREGLLAVAVPVELGGGGATVSQLAALQRRIAHHCGSTALASAMHQHVTAFTAWRHRRNLPGAEATLRRVVEEGIVLVSTGGGDFTEPPGRATKVEGGWRLSGRKRFASQSVAGAAISTMFTWDDPQQGLRVLNLAVPVSAEGVTVLDTWDTLGMRGTASNDIVFDDVFVPEERVLANRPHGVVDGPLEVISSIAFPIITAVYLGVAEAAFASAVEAAGRRKDDPGVQRQLGQGRLLLQGAEWALEGALRAVGDDPAPSAGTFLAVMLAKAQVVRAGMEVCDLAMDVAGGSAYFKGSVIERCYRDVRAGTFHPLTPEQTLSEVGRHELGISTLA